MINKRIMNAATKRPCGEGLTPERLERMAVVLKLLAHPHRLQIVGILKQRGEAPVYTIADDLGLPPAATSQLLNQMRRVNLLRSTRKGKEVWYAIADERSLGILQCIQGKEAS